MKALSINFLKMNHIPTVHQTGRISGFGEADFKTDSVADK